MNKKIWGVAFFLNSIFYSFDYAMFEKGSLEKLFIAETEHIYDLHNGSYYMNPTNGIKEEEILFVDGDLRKEVESEYEYLAQFQLIEGIEPQDILCSSKKYTLYHEPYKLISVHNFTKQKSEKYWTYQIKTPIAISDFNIVAEVVNKTTINISNFNTTTFVSEISRYLKSFVDSPEKKITLNLQPSSLTFGEGNDTLAIGCTNGSILLWKINQNKPYRCIKKLHTKPVIQLGFLNNDYLISLSHEKISIINTRTLQKIMKLQNSCNWIKLFVGKSRKGKDILALLSKKNSGSRYLSLYEQKIKPEIMQLGLRIMALAQQKNVNDAVFCWK